MVGGGAAMRWSASDLREGMLVTSTTGERIGKITRMDADTFVVEKGTLFPKDYELRYEYVTDVGTDGMTYALTGHERPIAEREGALDRARAAASSGVAKVAAAAGLGGKAASER